MNIDYDFNTVDGVNYTNEQITQIEKGIAHGLTETQIKTYVRPEFSALDMRVIRKAIEQSFSQDEVKMLTNTSDLLYKRKEIKKAIKHKICDEGIKILSDSMFDAEQAREIRKGFEHGLTFKQVLIYAWSDYPEYHVFARYPSEYMKEIRKALEAGTNEEYVIECTQLPFWEMRKKLRGM